MATEKRQRKKQGHQARLEAARAEARRRQRRRRLVTTAVLTVLAVVALFAISALGGDDESDDESEVATDDTSETSADEPTTTTTLDITKPEVTVPEGEPPDDTVITDLEEGDGPAAKLGDEVEVHYVGVSFADGEQFDSSWDRGAPATFTLQEGGLIEGWIKGMPGMKVGGRRQLVIPGSQAYGDEDTGDGRPHGALVFVIDLIAIK